MDRVTGLNQTREMPGMQPLMRSTKRLDLVAVTIRLLADPGTLTICSGPCAGCRPMTSDPQAP